MIEEMKSIPPEGGRDSDFYCIDCFTSSFGFEEFLSECDRDPVRPGFYPKAMKPVTIKALHHELRDLRRLIIERFVRQRFLRSTRQAPRKRVERVVRSLMRKRNPYHEREENVKIVYDSVTSLSTVFDTDDLLRFLIHDTNRDKTVGRNTLLLVKLGCLSEDTLRRLESICDVSMTITRLSTSRIAVDVKKAHGRIVSSRFNLE